MLDNYDREILREVQKNNQRTHAQIGKVVNLSPSSVRRRLKRLRKEKIIQSDVSIVDPIKTMIQAIVTVSFQQESLEGYQEFKNRMIAAPEVSQCYSISGDVDFILIVNTTDLASLEAWGERVLMTDAHIRRYNTHIIWSRVKFSTAIAL